MNLKKMLISPLGLALVVTLGIIMGCFIPLEAIMFAGLVFGVGVFGVALFADVSTVHVAVVTGVVAAICAALATAVSPATIGFLAFGATLIVAFINVSISLYVWFKCIK